jgi:hypothetical protein
MFDGIGHSLMSQRRGSRDNFGSIARKITGLQEGSLEAWSLASISRVGWRDKRIAHQFQQNIKSYKSVDKMRDFLAFRATQPRIERLCL